MIFVTIERILIYNLFRWSGITFKSLQNTTTTLSETQQTILAHLKASQERTGKAPILMGHSLDSDLKALKLRYEHCIDTALLFHHPRGKPMKPGLAWLTKKWLGKTIQAGGDGGHDPREDAMACLELVKRKMVEAPGWGELGRPSEGLFERIARVSGPAKLGGDAGAAEGEGGDVTGVTADQKGSGRLRTAIIDRGNNPAAWHGAKATTAIGCKTDEEVLENLLRVLPDHDFVYGRFMEIADIHGCRLNVIHGLFYRMLFFLFIS